MFKLQLAQTEALLKQEKLKQEAFETMINIAEKDGGAVRFKIPNKKKVWGAARAEEMLLNRCFFDIQTAEEKIKWAIENYNTF